MKPLWIFGGSSFAEIAVHYFHRDTDYEVQGLIMDSGFEPVERLKHLPVRRPDEMAAVVNNSGEVYFHVAVTYANMNMLRVAKIMELESLGMIPASYVSRHAYVDDSTTIGSHVFIFEDNTIQPFVEIGSGVVLWSGNHVGHHSEVEQGVFISSHVVISDTAASGNAVFSGSIRQWRIMSVLDEATGYSPTHSFLIIREMMSCGNRRSRPSRLHPPVTGKCRCHPLSPQF